MCGGLPQGAGGKRIRIKELTMVLFTPAKITDDQWAEKLLDGEVFMKPLREFGSCGRLDNLNDKKLNNNYRGDIFEGTSKVFASAEDSEFMQGVDPEFKNVANNLRYIDCGDIQYFKIFSLYCLEYDPQKDFFIRPDPKMREFGDTAIIICDFCEFLRRLALKVDKKWEKYLFLADRISFYDFSETKNIDPVFSKSDSFRYQNELRIAVGELKHNPFAREVAAKNALSFNCTLEREIFQIGSIKDIAIKLNIDDFLNLNLPNDFSCRWPTNNDPNNMTLFDHAVQDTKRQMSNYKSLCVNPTVTIY